MAVIAVGDFDDMAAIEKQIQARFGDLKNPANERARQRGGVPAADGTRIAIDGDRELPSTVVSVFNTFPHRPEASYKDYRRLVVEQVYQTILNDRFAVIARRPEAPFVAAGAGIASETREIDTFVRQAQAKPGKLDDAIASLFTEVLRVERHGVTETELERARVIIARSYEQLEAEDTTADSRNFTEELTRNFFEHELMVGRTVEKQLTLKYLPTITIAELNALAKAFGGAENRVILIAGPDASKAPPLPTRDHVLSIIEGIGKQAIEPWEDKASAAALMAQPPAAGKIVKETKIEAINVTEWKLSNGVRVIVKPTDYQADEVGLFASAPGGLAMASDKDYNDARFADDLAAIGGVGELDVDELRKLLAGKRASAAAAIDQTSEVIRASASARDLETMFQLVHLRMTAPRKDDRAIAVWRTNTIEQLTNLERVPEAKFRLQWTDALYNHHLRHRAAEPADVDRLDPDKALAFYRSRFGDASQFTFVIAGAFDLAQLRPLVETYLASLPAKGRKDKETDLGIREVGGVVQREWNFGKEPKAQVQLQFHGDETWSRDKEHDLVLLGQVLQIRLREVLREDKGGVYGVGVSGQILRSPHQERTFRISFGCDPARVDELVKATFDEIAQIQRAGVGDEYLDKVRETYLRERETHLRTNQFWIGWLSSAYRFGDDPRLALDPSRTLSRITSAHMKDAAKRYLDAKQYFEAVLLPAN
jgi:zinc protease